MRDYNRGNRSGGGGRFSGRDSRRRDSGPREMHKAICDECGKECEVPFKPSGDKPIYCSKCFETKNGGSSRRSGRRDSGRSDFGRRDNTNKQLLEQVTSINSKLDRFFKVLEGKVEKKPASRKPKVEKKVKVKKVAQVVEKIKEVKKVAPKVEKTEIEKVIKEEVEKNATKE